LVIKYKKEIGYNVISFEIFVIKKILSLGEFFFTKK